MKLFGKSICAVLAALIIISCTFCLYGCSDSADGSIELDYAKDKVQDYVDWQTKYNAEFYDEVYAKGNLAALCYSSDKDSKELEQIARNLYADSITITDDQGEIVADYPKQNKGKNIDDIDEFVKFKSILKWVCPRCATDPEKVEDSDEYAMTVGVQRVDDGGCVIVSFKTDAYSMVTGENLADECGPNVIVAKDKTVISSTLADVEAGKTFKELNISDNDLKADNFILTAGKDSYTCSSADIENYTIIYGKK